MRRQHALTLTWPRLSRGRSAHASRDGNGAEDGAWQTGDLRLVDAVGHAARDRTGSRVTGILSTVSERP